MKHPHYYLEAHQAILGNPLRLINVDCKWYMLWSEYAARPSAEAQTLARTIAQDKLEHHIADLHTGIGMVILTKGLLSVHLWDEKTPRLHTHLYSLQPHPRPGRRETIRQAQRTQTGWASIEEIALLEKEKNVWANYLRSGKKEADRNIYLTTGFTGRLD